MSFKTKLSIILAFFSLCNLSYAQGLSPNQKKSISSAYEGIPLDEILTTASEHFKYKENILIYGSGSAGRQLFFSLQENYKYKVLCSVSPCSLCIFCSCDSHP